MLAVSIFSREAPHLLPIRLEIDLHNPIGLPLFRSQRWSSTTRFWSPKFKIWRDVTIGDCFTKFENDRGGAIHNFDLVRDGKTGQHAGPPWYDGLIYEMIRGAADFLAAHPDPALEARSFALLPGSPWNARAPTVLRRTSSTQ